MNVEIYLDELNSKRAQNFFDIYTIDNKVSVPDIKTYLGAKETRKCRFCNRTNEDVSFSKDAHVIPEFMGNKKLLSYFECDECNIKFSIYEDSFAKFIGASRTISQIKGKTKTKVPKHKDPKSGLEISLGETGIHVGVQNDSNEVVIDEDAKELIIKTKRQTYVPIHIPKILTKIGMCLLKDDQTT